MKDETREKRHWLYGVVCRNEEEHLLDGPFDTPSDAEESLRLFKQLRPIPNRFQLVRWFE